MLTEAGEAWNSEKHIQTQLASTVIMRLWEDRTRGEIYMPLYDTNAVALVNDDYDRTMGDNWNVIDSGKHVFEFRPLKAGVHRIVFEKRMGWRFTAEDRRVYIVTVTDETLA
jgi:hypothetical protein